MSRKTEIQVGITVIVAIAVLLWGIAWVSTMARSQLQRVWHVTFPEGGGIEAGNEAHVNGVRKGVVKSVRLAGDRVLVDLALAKDVELTRDCRVSVRSFTMMGDRIVEVQYRATGEPWSTRDTIPGIYEKGLPDVMSDLGRASGGVSAIALQLDSLAVALAREGGLAATAKSWKDASRELALAVAENREELRTTMANLASASASARGLLTDNHDQLEAAVQHFSSAAEKLDRLSTRLDSLRATVQSAATKLDHGDGTLGRLVNDDKIYGELRSSVRELRDLIADVKANPRKYLKFSVF
jgi:phospholipid/cholesterol/gamma-HCH transport system substrate-binding protein